MSNLNQETELNKLRTIIRDHSVQNVKIGLQNNEKIFELTAPTGSGKTLMMLSLTSEIIKKTGPKRVIYGLPFLSITEQVESEVLNIFEKEKCFIQRIDSKSENYRFEEIQKELENDLNEEKVQEANTLAFQENTFSFPFIITTFVRFFETLLSNRNAELLKLPNFFNCIFLLDEIQALPPRLYGFFVAYLSRFCEKFDSYAIISTATQPSFELPQDNAKAKTLFKEYKTPYSLLPIDYFKNDLFNRYVITNDRNPISLEELKELVLMEEESTLIILNTIDDTKELYNSISKDIIKGEVMLLNTHITPRHRKIKIYLAKRLLRQNKRIILISTQLIEAGVDIDFPILYRDFATISSVIQSAGRCNRNGKLKCGKVKLIRLKNKGKIRSDLIYQGKDKEILRLTKESLCNEIYEEKDLIEVQKEFFNRIQSELNFAKHSQINQNIEFDFITDIEECMYEKIGRFRLIDEQLYGEEKRYYVPRNHNDRKFETLIKLQEELVSALRYDCNNNSIRIKKKAIGLHLKTMANNIIQIRLKPNQSTVLLGSEKNYFNLYKIDYNSYTFNNGIDLVGSEFIL